ncbi:hypothetical protein PF005_g22826 [Phytophthora fragariae]|uniref:Restriction endonuclease domain-containing protein n=1 Tax=Phytophthora fragariae TaxID=53985 RepID=A0A6A3E8F9_9STRA|nr:hypothetical protein PF003_g36408 [Phytophthora fragariae]KAE8926198.1 hypothetical protein PF009_g23608 [Phytophthora fragariae]KAE8974058.1 hypothetical protein PF011_g25007 [Phytophthora fragariae]KAE9080507.1 hypothetical protein PF007_g23028 [Phytophthora fragariae]KAE9080924.1 hypothetical protein PF010_g22201 [Phytophthora fragariae]
MKRMEAVAYINHVLSTIDWARLEAPLAAEDDGGPGEEICSVSLQEWEHYVRTEYQCLKSRAFSWYGGKVYLVEPSTSCHATIVSEISGEITFSVGYRNGFLSCSGSTYVASMRLLEPDTSFGPTARVPGAERPPRMSWGEYHTLKVEVGVARGWRKLDRRAEEWSHFPGVQYVLCVRVSNDLKTRQYRLNSVVDGHIETPRAPIIDIVNPTTVTFDSRRLLGLPPDAEVPLGFSDPTVTIDLFTVVDRGAIE